LRFEKGERGKGKGESDGVTRRGDKDS